MNKRCTYHSANLLESKRRCHTTRTKNLLSSSREISSAVTAWDDSSNRRASSELYPVLDNTLHGVIPTPSKHKVGYHQNILKNVDGIEESLESEKMYQTRKKQEIRMQEIEEILLERCIITEIDGSLAVWSEEKGFYQKHEYESFCKLIRSVLTAEEEWAISKFMRFREAYDFCLVGKHFSRLFTDEEIARVKHMIVFENGVFDTENERLLRFSPDYPVTFGIKARFQQDTETPQMDRLINCATGGDQSVLKLVYQTIGYLISHNSEAKKFFVMGTAPNSGKSILGEFLADIFDEKNVSYISLDQLGSRFSLGKIGTTILNLNMDLPGGTLSKDAVTRIKNLTGDSHIMSEEKYVQSRPVVHHCKFLFATNHPIRLKDDDNAFYDRMIVIPFIHGVDEEDKDCKLLDKLLQEKNAILSKAALAYSEVVRDNMVFQKTALSEAMLEEWKNTSEMETEKFPCLKSFWCTQCRKVDDPNMFVSTEEVFKKYQIFCEGYGTHIPDCMKIYFSRRFSERFGLKKCKVRTAPNMSPVNGFKGLSLIKSDDETEHEC